jgi:hypothetical protein
MVTFAPPPLRQREDAIMIRNGPASIARLGALALSACLAVLLPSAARATCLYLDATSDWALHQSNGPIVEFTLQQSDANFHGDAAYYVTHDEKMHGIVNGSASDSSLDFTINWDDGSIGEYHGAYKYHVADNNPSRDWRELVGTTVDRNHRGSPSTWYSRQDLKCLKYGPDNENWGSWGPPPPPVALGRVTQPAGAASGASMTSCERARDARARNSPAAAMLEAQCNPPVALGRTAAPSDTPAGPPMTICERARDARARDSPAAASLEAQCSRAAFSNSAPPTGRAAALRAVPSTGSTSEKDSICALAASARARNSPSAAGLEAQCRALAAKH